MLHVITFLRSKTYKGLCLRGTETIVFVSIYLEAIYPNDSHFGCNKRVLTPLSMSPLLSSSFPMSPRPLPRFLSFPPLIIPRPPLPLPLPRQPLPPDAQIEDIFRVSDIFRMIQMANNVNIRCEDKTGGRSCPQRSCELPS